MFSNEYRLVFRKGREKTEVFQRLHESMDRDYAEREKAWSEKPWWKRIFLEDPAIWKSETVNFCRNLQFQDSYTTEEMKDLFRKIGMDWEWSFFRFVSPVE